MIELTWGQIRDFELSTALNGLARQRVPYATTLKILTISKAIEAEQKKADEMATIIRDKYMKFDAEKKAYAIKDEALADELKISEKAFIETKFKIRANKIKSADLSGTELSAVELFKIEDLIEIEGDKTEPHLKSVEGNA